MASYKNVEIFATGFHHGRQYTPADLKQAYDNWIKLKSQTKPNGKPLIDPPLWLGHEELPELADRTDLPSFGQVRNVRLANRADGEVLMMADLIDVQPELAEWIDAKKIRHVSAEFYEDWTDEQGNRHGMVMRRVAVLGGTPPQVKSLNELPSRSPVAKHDDGQRTVTFQRIFKFADGESIMDREQMLQMLKGLADGLGVTFSPEFLDGLSDEQIGQLLKDLGPKTPEEPPVDPNAPPPDTALADAGKPGIVTPATPQIPSGSPQQVVLKYGDIDRLVTARVNAVLKPAMRDIQAANRQAADARKLAQKQKVKAFCDRMVSEGKVTPGELDPGPDPKNPLPTLADQLLAADDVNQVIKFGDSPKLLTALDMQMAVIERRRPVVKFGDTMPDPQAKSRWDAIRAEAIARQKKPGGGKTVEQKLRMLPPANAR